MKSIEEKAIEHVESVFSDFAELIHRPWPEFKDALIAIYLAGARESLTTQWQRPEALAECEVRKVITRYRSKYQGTWLTLTSAERPEDWRTEGLHKGDDLIAWMPIPEYPQKTK